MPKRRANSIDMIDDIVDTAVDSLFERGTEFFGKLREQRIAQATPAERDAMYACGACTRQFPMATMAMVNPRGVALPGVCQGCFQFIWQAGREKLGYLQRRAAEARAHQQADQARAQSASHAVPRKPWEVLGVRQDASIEEIKKAYRTLALQYHPDMVPASASSEEREAARAKFDEITRAQKVMLKVREAPEE